MAYTPDFELVHIGVNCADEAQAAECAHTNLSFVSIGCEPGQGRVRMHGLQVHRSNG